MDLKSRIERLESRIGIGDNEITPLIVLNATDCRKGSQDEGSPLLAVVPGRLGGPKGITMFRGKDEVPDDFLKRCEAKHAEFYV